MDNELQKSIDKTDDAVSMGTAICTHIPTDPFHHVGQITTCKLCSKRLCYNNHPPGFKHRMSKKERRKIQAKQRMVEEANVRR